MKWLKDKTWKIGVQTKKTIQDKNMPIPKVDNTMMVE